MSGPTPDPKHTLAAADREAIYKARIAPEVFRNATPTSQPTLVIIAGQPGAGKSGVRDAVKNELGGKGGVVVIDKDVMRTKHPKHRELSIRDEATAAVHTGPDAAAWVDRALADAKSKRVNVALESSLRSPDAAVKLIGDFKEAGYRVEVRALAVPERDSLRGIQSRSEALRARNEPARPVPRALHDEAVRALPESLKRIENETKTDRVMLVKRDGAVVYDNQQVNGQWLIAPPIADKRLQMERERPRTREELQQRTIEWDAIEKVVSKRPGASLDDKKAVTAELAQARSEFKEHLNRMAPMNRQESMQKSLDGAQRIARTLGGAGAQLTSALPGHGYKGPILGETSDHVVQGGSSLNSFIAHEKRKLAAIPAVGTAVEVRYSANREYQASVTTMQLPEQKKAAEVQKGKDADLDR